MSATAAEMPKAIGARGVLAIPDFRRIAAAQFISDFGDALTLLATLLVINDLTGSLAAIAFMAIVVAIPAVAIGPLAGVWVDRLEPRLVMLVSDGLRAAIVLGFVLVRSADMVWLLFVLGFAESAVGTLLHPGAHDARLGGRPANRPPRRELHLTGGPRPRVGARQRRRRRPRFARALGLARLRRRFGDVRRFVPPDRARPRAASCTP